MVALSLNLLPAGRILTRDPTEVNAHIIHLPFRFFLAAVRISPILLYVSSRNSNVQAGAGGCGGHSDCR